MRARFGSPGQECGMHSGVDSQHDSMMEDSGVDSDVDDGLGFENVEFIFFSNGFGAPYEPCERGLGLLQTLGWV